MRLFDYKLPPNQSGEKLKTFYGTLTASDWNNHDEPTEFSLFTVDEDDLLLGSPHLKNKYINLLNHPVEVIGEKKVDGFGDCYISVSKIKRLKGPEFQFLSLRERNRNIADYQEYHHHIQGGNLENLENQYLQTSA